MKAWNLINHSTLDYLYSPSVTKWIIQAFRFPTENWTGIPAGSQWDDLIPVGCCHFSGMEIHPSGMEIHPSGIPVITYRDFQVHFPVGSHLNSILDWTYFCWLLFFPFSQLAFFLEFELEKCFINRLTMVRKDKLKLDHGLTWSVFSTVVDHLTMVDYGQPCYCLTLLYYLPLTKIIYIFLKSQKTLLK